MKTATFTASFQLELHGTDDASIFDYLETCAGIERCIVEVVDEFAEPPIEEIGTLILQTIDSLNEQLSETRSRPIPFKILVDAVDKGSLH